MSETTATTKKKAKPLFLITPGSMTPRDIRRAEKECGIVIAECKDPTQVRCLEPPIDAEISVQARAALALARMLVNYEGHSAITFNKGELVQFFTRALINSDQPQHVTKVKK